MAAIPVPSDSPTGRLNEKVVATKGPWWLIASGAIEMPEHALDSLRKRRFANNQADDEMRLVREIEEVARMPQNAVVVEQVEDESPWERARREGWEGVIAKRLGSPYEHRRS